MRPALAPVVVVLLGLGLAGCGGSDDPGTAEPAPSATSSANPSASPSVSRSVSASVSASVTTTPEPSGSDTEQTCGDLYDPPDQLMPRAIEFVHDNTTGDPVAEAGSLVSLLSTVAGTADPTLAADIAIVRISVDAQRALLQSGVDTEQDLTSFDEAAQRLGKECAPYGE